MLPACRNIKSQPSGGGRVTRLKSGVTRSSPDPHLLPDTALPHLAHHLLHGAHRPRPTSHMGRKLTTGANWHSVLQAHHLLRRLEAWTTMLHSLLLHLLHVLQLLLSQLFMLHPLLL